MTGIRTSISITSGRSLAASATASAPLPASPTTSMSGSPASNIVNPLRTSAWSSATTTRIVMPSRLERHAITIE